MNGEVQGRGCRQDSLRGRLDIAGDEHIFSEFYTRRTEHNKGQPTCQWWIQMNIFIEVKRT